jgi:hypothetical protein
MSRLIITGCTGSGESPDPRLLWWSSPHYVAGSAILAHALASPQVEHVTTLSRRPPFNLTEDAKLTSAIIPSDECPKGFDELSPALIDRLKAERHNAVIWALGISQTQVSRDQYVQ